MGEIVSLDDYRSKKPMNAANPDVISEQELAELEEAIWQACKSVELDQFFINLFTDDIPEREDTEREEEEFQSL